MYHAQTSTIQTQVNSGRLLVVIVERRNRSSALVAEAQSALLEVQLALASKAKRVILKGDWPSLIQYLNYSDILVPWEVSSAISDILILDNASLILISLPCIFVKRVG